MANIFITVVAVLSGISAIAGVFMGKKFEESTLAPAIAIIDIMIAMLGGMLVLWLRILGTGDATAIILLGLAPIAALGLGVALRRIGRRFMNRVATTF